jgi:hypothetical protein
VYAPVPEAIIRNLEAGNFHMSDELIRQPAATLSSSTNQSLTAPSSTTSTTTTTTTRTAPAAPPRRVVGPLTFLEAHLASSLPVLINAIAKASSLPAAHAASVKAQQFVCFLLHAMQTFESMSFSEALDYLETHRNNCSGLNNTANIAEHDHKIAFNILLRRTSRNSYHGSSASENSNGSNYNNNNRSSRNDGVCRDFNKEDGCKRSPCSFKHTCFSCGGSHGRSACTRIGAGNSSTNNNSSSNNSHSHNSSGRASGRTSSASSAPASSSSSTSSSSSSSSSGPSVSAPSRT